MHSARLSRLHIPALSGVRIVPASMIFFYHWLFDATDAWPSALRAIFKQGYLGVAIFFALSGFLFALRYAPNLPNTSASQYGRFVLHRFLRIYPLYFFILTVFVVWIGRPEGLVPTARGHLFLLYALLQSFSPPLLLAGVQTAWTLTISEMFYLLAPWLLRAMPFGSAWRRQFAFVGLISVFGLGLAFGLSRLPAWPGSLIGAPLGYVLFRTIIGRLPEFLLGVLAGHCYLRHQMHPGPFTRYLPKLIWPGIALILVCALMMDGLNVPEANSILFFVLNAGTAVATAVALLGLASDISRQHIVTRFLSQKPMIFLGKISYAFFLIQLTEPCQWLYWIVFGSIEGRWSRAILLYVATLAFSALLYLMIEKPTDRLVRKLEQKAIYVR